MTQGAVAGLREKQAAGCTWRDAGLLLLEQPLGMEEGHPFTVSTFGSGPPQMLGCLLVNMWLLLKACPPKH